MSAQGGTLNFYLPPVSSMTLVHWLCGLSNILGRACLACHQVNHIGGLTCEVMSDEIGQSSESTPELPRFLESRAEQACSTPVSMVMPVATWSRDITGIREGKLSQSVSH